MKINGSLVFDGSTASEIQNLRLQKVTALPGILDSDVGRLVYNTQTNSIHVGANVGNVLSWVPLATGGDASALLAEVDRIETSLGLNADGTFNAAAFTGNLADHTSYAALITTLQGLAATNAGAIAAETTRATAAEGAIDGRVTTLDGRVTTEVTRVEGLVTAETTRATGAEDTLRTDLGAETTRATTAEGALGTRIDGVTAAATAESTRIEGLITTETTRATGAEGALRTDLDAEVARATAAEGVNATAITTELTRATAAEGALGDRIDTEIADRTAAVDAVAAGLATEITDRTTAITGVTTAIGAETTRATAAEAAIRGEMAAALVGLTWEAPVDLIAADIATVDAAGLADGYRVANMADNAIYTVTGGVFGPADPLADGAAFFNRTNDTGYTFTGTEIVPFTGASTFVAGAGLAQAGNVFSVGNDDGSITVEADSIRVSEAIRTEITDNAAAVAAEVTRATAAETGLGDRIDGETAARTAAITAETDRATAAETANAAAITAETTRATAAEAALGGRIDAAETAATDAVAAETARATGAETALGGRIDTTDAALAAEVTRATAAEGANATAITAETTRATAAETALGGRIDTVETSVTDLDTRVTDRINSMYFLYDGAAAATHTVAHGLGQRYCNVTVVDATDNVVIPESIVFTDVNTLTVTFNTAIACRVVVMGLAPAAPAAV